MSENISVKCGITFICKDLSSTEYAQCAVLMNYLVGTGYTVNLITDERPKGNEFRYDYRINHFSVDTPFRFMRTRQEIIADFAKRCNSSLFVLFTSSAYMCSDSQVLQSSGYKVAVVEDLPLLSVLNSASAQRYKRYLDALSKADSVISLSYSAFTHLKENNLDNVVYSPYLVPFTFGELYENDDPDSIALFFKDKSLTTDKVKEVFLFVKENCPDTELIVHGLNEADYPADEGITFTQEGYIEFISRCKKAMIFSAVPYTNDIAVSLTARRIPFAFFSGYSDSSLNANSADNLIIPEDVIRFTLDDQKELCSKIERFFESIMSGKADKNIFADPEYADDTFIQYYNSLAQKHKLSSVSAECDATSSQLRQLIKLPVDYFEYSEGRRYKKYRIHQTSDETVRKCQLLALYMLDEFERICKKHSLRYYIAAGSLLGAVRHSGVIPWDDDIDVTMPRPDYEAFIRLAQKELPDDIALPKRNFPYGFTRMMIKDTKVNRIIRQNGPHGVFMDVLPIDGAAPDEASAERHAEETKKILRLMHVRALPIPQLHLTRSSATALIYHTILKCIPKSFYLHRWKKIYSRYSTEKSDSWICLPGTYGYEKECFPKEYWGEPVMMMYNGTMRPVMKEWEEYLTLHYGDYMRTPALLFRRTHGSLSIELGKYENMSIEELESYLNNKRKEVSDK